MLLLLVKLLKNIIEALGVLDEIYEQQLMVVVEIEAHEVMLSMYILRTRQKNIIELVGVLDEIILLIVPTE
jgi:hypothetical protein